MNRPVRWVRVQAPDAGRRRLLAQAVAWPVGFGPATAWHAVQARQHPGGGAGYGKDPAMKGAGVPWPRVLSPAERAALTVLADRLLPTDASGPGAVALGVVDFLDEWCSAPYPEQQEDLRLLREAMPRIDDAAVLADAERIQTLPAPARQLAERLRALVVIGWGTTPEGAAQLGFVGNVPRLAFDGPPPEVMDTLSRLAKG